MIKKTTLLEKKVSFGPNNVAKTCFLGFLRQHLKKMLRKLAVLLRLSSNLQDRRLLYCKRCTINKIDHFSSKRNKFWTKQRRKNVFFGVLRQYLRKTLCRLTVLLRLSSNLQDRRLLYCKRCTNNKIDHFRPKRNKFWAKQRRKKTCFLGFLRHYLRKTLRKFAVMLRLSLNLQGSRLFDCKRWAINKIDHFG